MKKFFAILIIPIVFLTIFSVYRVQNDKEPLSVKVFLSTLNQLDYDFENTQKYISNVSLEWQNMINDWSEPLPPFTGDISTFFGFTDIFEEFFNRIVSFTGFLASIIYVVFGFLLDFIELFISIVKVLFSLLGFSPLGGVNG